MDHNISLNHNPIRITTINQNWKNILIENAFVWWMVASFNVCEKIFCVVHGYEFSCVKNQLVIVPKGEWTMNPISIFTETLLRVT